MSLPHALLTSLLERPSSGLELANRFDRSIGFFWTASHQQIYRELARLERATWVTSTAVEEGRGRKRLYRVLPAGRKELKRWVAEEAAPNPLRDEMMVRLRAEAVVGPTHLGRDLERRVELHRKKLATYREIEARDFSGTIATRSRQLQHLVLRTGILHETMYIEVTLAALAILDRREEAMLESIRQARMQMVIVVAFDAAKLPAREDLRLSVQQLVGAAIELGPLRHPADGADVLLRMTATLDLVALQLQARRAVVEVSQPPTYLEWVTVVALEGFGGRSREAPPAWAYKRLRQLELGRG